MEDFRGTSIQFAEQEILRLEREHAEQMERTANELIEKGFLDTDYEDSDTESTITDCSESLSRSIESVEYPTLDIASPREAEIQTEVEPPSSTVSPQYSTSDDALATESEIEEPEPNVDDELIGDVDIDDETDERESIMSEILSSMETIVSDIRGVAMMVFVLVALQMANERTDRHFDDDDSYDRACPRLHRHTQIHFWQDIDAIRDGDEKNEDNENDEAETVCATRRTLNFDVTTTTFDRHTNTVIQSKSFGHAIPIRVNDLFCDDASDRVPSANAHVSDVARNDACGASTQRQMYVPRLLLQFGAGMNSLKSPQVQQVIPVMRIFKETVTDTGRHLVRNHGLTALVMSFAGIAAVTAASSGLDDLL